MISEARLMSILRAPLISEKSTAASENSVVTFKVMPDATKEEIKAAVEKIFGVEVLAVRTLNYMGKTRRTIHGMGKRNDWKKAYVTLPAGTQLDVDTAAQQNEETK